MSLWFNTVTLIVALVAYIPSVIAFVIGLLCRPIAEMFMDGFYWFDRQVHKHNLDNIKKIVEEETGKTYEEVMQDYEEKMAMLNGGVPSENLPENSE